MKQNKRELQGVGKVFQFTLVQFVKNKANTITLIIMFVLTLFSVPVMTLFSGGGMSAGETSGISKVYWQDQTGYSVNPAETAQENDFYRDTVFEEADFSAEDFASSAEDGSVYVLFSSEEAASGTVISIQCLPEQEPSESDLSSLETLMSQALEQAKLSALQISEEQTATLFSGLSSQVQTMDEYQEGKGVDWSVQYGLQLGYSIVVMIISIFAVTYIVRAVVEEKASKLVEMLMVSVQPLALLVGKILAAMVYIFGFFVLLLAGIGISWVVSSQFMDVSAISETMAASGFSMDLLQLSPATLVIVLVSLLLGYLTFSILAGLSGTGCSTMEDVQGASTLSTMLIFVGYFAAVIAGSIGGDVLNLFVSLCPVISVFCAPVQYVLGNIGFGILLLSWLLQAAVIVLLAVFSARVYRALLMYRGSRPNFRQMFAMAKEQSSGKEQK